MRSEDVGFLKNLIVSIKALVQGYLQTFSNDPCKIFANVLVAIAKCTYFAGKKMDFK
jgi:hypothetical protein